MRKMLRNVTGQENYLRPVNLWYRNIEFGKVVADPLKRGRQGNGINKKLRKSEWNSYPRGDTYQAAHRQRSGSS